MAKKCCDLAEISRSFRVIADEHRLCILHLLRKKELCVCEIWGALDLPQNLVSHHLKVLTRAGFIRVQKEGRWNRYSLNPVALRPYAKFLANF